MLFPLPVTSNQGVLSGVEINANILASLLDQRSIIEANHWQALFASSLILSIALASLLIFSPRTALAIVIGLIITTLIMSIALLHIGYWLAPGPR